MPHATHILPRVRYLSFSLLVKKHFWTICQKSSTKADIYIILNRKSQTFRAPRDRRGALCAQSIVRVSGGFAQFGDEKRLGQLAMHEAQAGAEIMGEGAAIPFGHGRHAVR